MAKYETKFRPGEMVLTPLLTMGIIGNINIDATSVQYYVKEPSTERWWGEEELKPYEPPTAAVI